LYQSLGKHINEYLEQKRPMGAAVWTNDREFLRHGGFDWRFTTAMATTHGGILVQVMSLQSSTATMPEVLSDGEDSKDTNEAAA
jgi:hypothetical protein